ncbi:thrombin-like enzyme acutin [Eupeodes corollae]|uniref:thrombin-like enzyme acutin n=1 Tax=Eupeodes corollae TaxID=290404 RepID=UPI0024928B7D|nr:thrombin-like enzyme acutin [Eupeodes corollae]
MRALVFICFCIFFKYSLAISNEDGRIINGHLTGNSNTKHQVSIREKILDDFYFGLGFLCGGSLISPNSVLTAAHCLLDSSESPINATALIVAMGNLVKNVRDNDTLVFNIKKYLVHPNYNRTTITFDIAYIFLDGKVPNDHPTIQPISLVDTKMPLGTVCEVTGWGYTEKDVPSDDLLAVDVRIIDINVCQIGYDGILKLTGQLCAGYMTGKRDACGGDSGGPLVCNGKLTGIVSFGVGCGSESKPGIYTDVLFFKTWIRRIAKNTGSSFSTKVSLLILPIISIVLLKNHIQIIML